MNRDDLQRVLAKPMTTSADEVGYLDEETHEPIHFDPWEDVIKGIYGHYAAYSDTLMISALKAVHERTTFEFIKEAGFAGEFALYILAGHGLTEYSTSPRGAWAEPAVADLFPLLIERWETYARIMWGENESL